ncbi:MAG: PAS domain S-box protein [Bacteroidota bacterium]
MKLTLPTEKILIISISLLLLAIGYITGFSIVKSWHTNAGPHYLVLAIVFVLLFLLLVLYLKEIQSGKQKEAREKIIKFNRLYHFISQINQMLVKVTDEETLFSEACRIAVDVGTFRMAWIGMIDEQTKKLLPVVHAGEEKDYLSKINITSLAGGPGNKGPTGTALKEGRYIFCNDIENEPEMAPWKEAALGRNYHSSISLPIKKSGKVSGAFNLYASVKNFFDVEEIRLLEEVTDGISFALDVFDKEKLRKKTEEDLLSSKKRYQTLAESSPVGIFHTDASGYTTYVNPRWSQISGMPGEEALGNGWLKAVHKDDKDVLARSWVEASKIQRPSLAEYRFVHPDGDITWVLGQATPERNLENQIVGYIGTITDITERKKADQEIARVHKENETVLNRINDAMVSVDKEWRYTFLNDVALLTHPSGREKTIGKGMWDIHPEMKGTVFWDKYHEAMETQKVVEIESFYEPMNAWFSVKVYPSNDGLTIFYRDITGKVTAQNEIITEKNLSDSIINSLPGVFYLYNKEGKFLRWNKNFETITMYGAEEIRQMHPLDFFDTAEGELVAERIDNTFNNGEDSILAHFLLKSKETIPYYFTGKAIEYEGSTCLVGVGIDFTERVKAQEKIKETTEQLRQLTAHLQDIREEERKRIGREIHDELGQQLTAIKMDIAWIDKKIPGDAGLIKSKLKNVIGLLDGSNQSIRRILSELRPGILDNRGLLEAIEWLSRQFTANTGIPVEFTSTERELKLPEPLAICTFRVYQEALTNILRHARAGKVWTSLNITGNTITISINDDGTGFDPTSVKNNKSFGILGMKERVLSVGGKFELISSPGKGTTIIISLPITL